MPADNGGVEIDPSAADDPNRRGGAVLFVVGVEDQKDTQGLNDVRIQIS
jgi:hypothetical protein